MKSRRKLHHYFNGVSIYRAKSNSGIIFVLCAKNTKVYEMKLSNKDVSKYEVMNKN